MREFKLPYGKEKLTLNIEEEHLGGVLVSKIHDYNPGKSGKELVREALENPIGTPRLKDMAEGEENSSYFFRPYKTSSKPYNNA